MIAYDRLAGTYLTDILDQPRALRDTIERLSHLPQLDTVRLNLESGRLRRVVLTGMGGSYQILHPLHLRLLEAGFDSVMAETSELIHTMPSLLDARNVVVAVSQSGASAETVRMLDREGPLFIGVTNTPGSRLAAEAHVVVPTHAGEEGGVSSKTAVTSLAALFWLGEHLAGGGLTAARAVLDALPALVSEYLGRWREHVAELLPLLAPAERVFFAGRGASLAAAGLGAMIQKEAAHFHGEGMSSAALRHGPFEMLGPESAVVVFAGAGNVRELNAGLVRDAGATGARAFLCGAPPFGAGAFALPDCPEPVRPVLELLPAQMISLAAAYLRGREPGRFERITKVTTVE